MTLTELMKAFSDEIDEVSRSLDGWKRNPTQVGLNYCEGQWFVDFYAHGISEETEPCMTPETALSEARKTLIQIVRGEIHGRSMPPNEAICKLLEKDTP